MLKRQKGQGMVEFVLISPVLLLTILAIIETALIFQGYLTVQHAAREAARWAVTYRPDRGFQLDGSPCDGVVCDPNESEDVYWARRVDLIKNIAVDKAVGLRIDPAHLGLTDIDFQNYAGLPNFYGVEVWGFPSFEEPSGGWTDGDLRNHPGLQGLPVRVRVTHNVELLDPLTRAIVPRVRVVAQSEMINEGTQAGYGNVAPPALPPPPPLPPLPPPGGVDAIVDFRFEDYSVGEAGGVATIEVVLDAAETDVVTVNYYTADCTDPDCAQATLDYSHAAGTLIFNPGVTSQTFDVPIIDDAIGPPADGAAERVMLHLSGGNAIIGPINPATLTILDNDGSSPWVDFASDTYTVDEFAGTVMIDVLLSFASPSDTIMVDFATSDGTATAGVDYIGTNGTLTFLPGQTVKTFVITILDDANIEPNETVIVTLSNAVNAGIGPNSPATLTILDDDIVLTPTPTGPFIAISDYEVIPSQVVLIDVNQHPPAFNPYELVLVDGGGAVIDVISPTLNVDPVGGSGFKLGIIYTIPSINQGAYYVETRLGGSLFAQSAAVQVEPPEPDLVVRSIGFTGVLTPNQEITVTTEVENLTASTVSGFFDVDLYVDPAFPPMGNRPGDSKQWVQGIGPLETKVITHVVTLYGGGVHELWAQVDTSDWVPNEVDENNNILGPIAVTAASGECAAPDGTILTDRFAGAGPGPNPKWTSARIGDATVFDTIVSNGELAITSNGSSLWNSPDGGAGFLYQSVTGDFVATLKIDQGMQGSGQRWAKIGLMARDTIARDSRWTMVMKGRDAIQFGFRTGGGGNRFADDVNTGEPVWVRLVRSGNTFAGYFSTDGSTWIAGQGNGENGAVTVNMGSTILIGIAASSYSGTPATAVVDDFEVCFLGAPPDLCLLHSDDFDTYSTVTWSEADVGSTVPGSSSEGGGVLTVSGNGGSLWGSDNFHYTYQPVSGNFVATLQILSGPTQAEWSKAGLMVRGSTAQDSAQVMVVKTRDHGLQFGRRASDGGPNERFAGDTNDPALPVWVRILRNGTTFSVFHSTDGANWSYAGATSANIPNDALIGMAVSSYRYGTLDNGVFDNFLFCPGEGGGIDPPIIPPTDKPPGFRECVQSIDLGNFESGVITPPWERNVDAFHASDRKHSGNFSLEFRAKLGPRPEYKHLNPWAYQVVAVPGDALPSTTGTLTYWQLVAPDASPDPDDHFNLTVRDSGGVTQTSAIPLAHGDTSTPVFAQNVVSVETHLPGNGFADLAGQDIQLKFYGVHDGDTAGTSFYIDDVRFDICTIQPIPPDVPGTASIGGLIEVLLNRVPTKMPGIPVWAFAPGGQLYVTQTIHNSTYHFYNIPPGSYTIYSEVWAGGVLYSSSVDVTVVADERNYTVDMLLQ